MISQKVTLDVNDQAIPIKGFVQDFIANVVTGMIATLKGTGEKQNILLSVESNRVSIQADGTSVLLKPFVSDFIKSTVCGMVGELNGIGQIDRLLISILVEP
jgi:hypothetical protein